MSTPVDCITRLIEWRRLWRGLLLMVGMAWAIPSVAGDDADMLSHGRFEQVRVFRTASEPSTVAVLLSPTSGWDKSVEARARTLQSLGTFVIGVDTRVFFETVLDEDEADECEFADGDIENLSRYVQAWARLRHYHLPVLVGSGSSASLAMALMAQAPADTFGGLMTEDFCPRLDLPRPVCAAESLVFAARKPSTHSVIVPPAALNGPWASLLPASPSCDVAGFKPLMTDVVTGGASDAAWSDAWRTLAKQVRPGAPEVPVPEGLPIEEVPARTQAGDLMAVFLSGDGGWAGIDKDVADALSARGIPVAGWDSLRYFWTARTPEGMAADASRVIRFYQQRWHKRRVLLIGYSQGANVMPFIVNRLEPEVRRDVALTVMMGLEDTADFEFHVANWVSDTETGTPVVPEVERFKDMRALCIHGQDEEDSACPDIRNAAVENIPLAGGHHFDGNYDELAAIVLRKVMP